MKIAFLFKRDSHFKAVKSTALRVCVQYNCEPVFIGIDSEFLPSNEAYSVIHIEKHDLTSLYEYDYVIACLGGYLLNKVVSALRYTDTKIVSIFPGIVSHYQLDAFISRLNADQVWLNSKADFDLYSNICNIFKHPNNGILYGMSWLSQSNYKYSALNLNAKKKEAIFFEQTEIFNDDVSKNNLLKVITKLVETNPDVLFKYKIRDNSNDQFFITIREHLRKLKNVQVITSLNDIDIATATYYLSISSSALIEGIAYGKKSFIVDYSLMDSDSREFYNKSNIYLKSSKLPDLMKMRSSWYNWRIMIPKEEFSFELIKKSRLYVNDSFRSIFYIRLKIFRLMIVYPKMALLLINKYKLLQFQKSIEYLGCNKYE